MSSAPGRIVAVTPGGGWQRRQGVTWESAVAWAYDDEGSIWPVMPSDEGPTLIDYSEAQWRQVPEEHPDDVDGALDVEPAAHMMSENPYRMPAGGVTNLTATEVRDLTGCGPVPPGAQAPRWNPWVALNDHPEVTLSWADMIGTDGLTIWSATGKVKILLQASMSVLRATCVLTHELIHVEDGRRYTEDTPLHEIDVLERFVREETARRLVPPAELAWFLTRPRHRVLHRGYVAAYFGVTRAVGDLALQMLVENARDLSLFARAVVSDAMA